MNSSSPTTSPGDPLLSLLERWYAGERDALDALLADVQPWLHKEIRRSFGEGSSVQDSMDVLQSVLLNFLTWGPRFRPQSGAQFRALLKRIATNEIIDQRRRAGSKRTSHLESLLPASQSMGSYGPAVRSSLSPSAAVARDEEREWLKVALQFLDDDERYLLIASEVENLPWSQIAAELGMDSADAARVRATRLKPRVVNLLRQLKAGRTPA